MTELVYKSMIDFLLPKSDAKLDYKFSTLFAAGEVYISAIIDTLTCQAYYNQHIVTILRQILLGSLGKEEIQITDKEGNFDDFT